MVCCQQRQGGVADPESESKVSVVTRPGMDGLAAGKPQLGLSPDMLAQHVCAEMAEMNRLQEKARTSRRDETQAGRRPPCDAARPLPVRLRMDPADNERAGGSAEEQAAIVLSGRRHRRGCRIRDLPLARRSRRSTAARGGPAVTGSSRKFSMGRRTRLTTGRWTTRRRTTRRWATVSHCFSDRNRMKKVSELFFSPKTPDD